MARSIGTGIQHHNDPYQLGTQGAMLCSQHHRPQAPIETGLLVMHRDDDTDHAEPLENTGCAEAMMAIDQQSTQSTSRGFR
jgi:hypothetical protein